MNCDEHQDLLGLGDDELTQEERSRLGKHLASCTPCSVERQQALAGRDALGELSIPGLSALEVERTVAAAMPGEHAGGPVPLKVGRRRAPRWVSWASHAAAIFLGVLLARSGSSGLFLHDAESDTVERIKVEPGEPMIREVLVEVPVETIVERIVEVPIEVTVERPVEVRVEVPVEVEKIIYRDRIIVHPLQVRWDAQLAAADTVGKAGLLALQGLDRALTRMADASASPDPVLPIERAIGSAVVAAAEPRGRARAVASESSQAHVQVRRRDGRVTLVTRGALADVVPVLIDTFETGDRAVAAAAFDRLQSIRAGFGEEGLALSLAAESRLRPGGIRGILFTKNERAPGPTPQDPELWRDWWSRQKAASGLTTSTTSI
ncbi:MAG: hypothetical protein ACJA2W_000153 [Planctomycetota bacterium]|jgi:hypothetical protein